MNTTEQTDLDLHLALLQGDEAAFNELYNKYASDVRRAIWKYAPKNLQSETDDICQFFWLKVHQYAHTYGRKAPFRNWLFALTPKVCARYYREQMPKSSISLADFAHRENEPHAFRQPSSREPDPGEQAILNEARGQVRSALRQLHPRVRTVIRAVYFKGKRPEKEAQKLGISVRTYYKQMGHGLARLRKILNQPSATS